MKSMISRVLFLLFLLSLPIVSIGCTEKTEPQIQIPQYPQDSGYQKKSILVECSDQGIFPDPIQVKFNDVVTLNIQSLDEDYNIVIPVFGINEFIPANNEAEVVFLADKKGRYQVYDPRNNHIETTLIIS